MNESATVAGKRLMRLGLVVFILGMIAILAPIYAGSAVVITIGIILLLVGISQIIQGIRAESMNDRILPLMLGVITTLSGIFVIGHPLLGLGFLTLLLLVYFMVEGVWKIIASFRYRPAQGWVWLLVSGLLSLILALLIWNQWPVSGMWAVGILVGVNLIATGVSLILLASSLRSLTSSA